MARCPTCQSDTFRVDESQAGPVLACDGCGRALGAAIPARMEALIRELEALREEVGRLRHAVNFLNQRVR